MPRNATSARTWVSAATVTAPTAARVAGRTWPGSRCRSSWGIPDSRAATVIACVITVSSRPARCPHIRTVVDPASISTEPPDGGSCSAAGRRDPVLLLGVGPVPLADGPFQGGEHGDRYGASVHAPEQPDPLEDGEVAADGLGGHAVGLRQVEHREPAALEHERGDRLLALLGVHPSLPARARPVRARR